MIFRWRGTFCSWALPMLQILVQTLPTDIWIHFGANVCVYKYSWKYWWKYFLEILLWCWYHLLTAFSGGTGVVTGSPPNLVVPEILNKVIWLIGYLIILIDCLKINWLIDWWIVPEILNKVNKNQYFWSTNHPWLWLLLYLHIWLRTSGTPVTFAIHITYIYVWFSELWSSHGTDICLLDGFCDTSDAAQPGPGLALASEAAGRPWSTFQPKFSSW